MRILRAAVLLAALAGCQTTTDTTSTRKQAGSCPLPEIIDWRDPPRWTTFDELTLDRAKRWCASRSPSKCLAWLVVYDDLRYRAYCALQREEHDMVGFDPCVK